MKIGVLGGGTMGEIIVRALLQREFVDPERIRVAETVAERRAEIGQLEVEVTASADDLVGTCDVLLVCVKPQNARAVLAPLGGRLPGETLVVSIMAGVDLGFLACTLAHDRVVRAMPNLPARIGRGITVWCPAPAVPETQQILARMVFQAFGREVRVEQEELVDAATAVSGTGPAYIFFIAENLLGAALELGFDEQQALRLVRGTFRGAMDLWAATDESPVELRRQVTSKGGTTHAAVSYFQKHEIAQTFTRGVNRAYQRAKELAALALDKSKTA